MFSYFHLIQTIQRIGRLKYNGQSLSEICTFYMKFNLTHICVLLCNKGIFTSVIRRDIYILHFYSAIYGRELTSCSMQSCITYQRILLYNRELFVAIFKSNPPLFVISLKSLFLTVTSEDSDNILLPKKCVTKNRK